MKITFVTPYFAPAWGYGGPPKVLTLFAEELLKVKNKVDVITTDALDKKRNDQTEEFSQNLRIFRFPTISNNLAFYQKVFFVQNFLYKTKDVLLQSDVVLFSDLRTILNWQLYSFLVKHKIPYGIFPFGQIPYPSGFKSAVKFVFDKLWVKNFLENAHWRFAQTSHEQKMYEEKFGIPISKTILLHLPTKKTEIHHWNNNDAGFFTNLDINSSDKILLFIGRINYLKGLDLLVDAVKPLFAEISNLKLLIVGRDDGFEKKLRMLISPNFNEKIVFSGPLYDHDLEKVYKRVACFIITPRYFEETSAAALEALSWGVPVITTKQSEIPFLEDYKAGLIVENNSLEIQKAIKKIFAQNSNILKRNAKKLISEQFESKAVTNKLLEYIKTK